MKTKLLSLLFLLPVSAMAQDFELGIGGGVSINGKPTNNEIYRGNEITPNYATNLVLLKNYPGNWQLGLDVHVLGMSRKSTENEPQLFSADPGGKGMKFIFGQLTTSLCATVNHKFMMGNNYFYVGLEAGLGIERNFNTMKPSGDVYYKAPDGGYGLVYGPHAGYTYRLSKRLSLNAELAVQVYDVDYDCQAPYVAQRTNLHYRITAYPLTVGVRYNMGGLEHYNKNTGVLHNADESQNTK